MYIHIYIYTQIYTNNMYIQDDRKSEISPSECPKIKKPSHRHRARRLHRIDGRIAEAPGLLENRRLVLAQKATKRYKKSHGIHVIWISYHIISYNIIQYHIMYDMFLNDMAILVKNG